MEESDIKRTLNEHLRMLFDISHHRTSFRLLFKFQIASLGQPRQQIVASQCSLF